MAHQQESTLATTQQSRSHRVLIVDDHPVVRFGLRQALEDEGDFEVCGEASSAQEALALCERLRPDLAIVDISLPGQNGLELLKHLQASHSTVKSLVWSMHDEELFAQRAISAGARGYIEKITGIDGLVSAARDVLAGRIHLSQTMKDRMLNSLVTGSPEATGVERLSDRELEVFELLGNAKTTREIAAQLGLSVKTVETYRENIKNKLDLANNNELIRQAVEWALLEGGAPRGTE